MEILSSYVIITLVATIILSVSAFAPVPLAFTSKRGSCLMMSEDTQTGTVKWYDPEKGFGFILMDDSGEDIFVHNSNIVMEGFRSLDEGETVSFHVGHNDKGRNAENVQIIDAEQLKAEREAASVWNIDDDALDEAIEEDMAKIKAEEAAAIDAEEETFIKESEEEVVDVAAVEAELAAEKEAARKRAEEEEAAIKKAEEEEAAEKKAEEARIAAEKEAARLKAEEEERIAAEKEAEAARVKAEEEARIAAEKAEEEARIAAEKEAARKEKEEHEAWLKSQKMPPINEEERKAQSAKYEGMDVQEQAYSILSDIGLFSEE